MKAPAGRRFAAAALLIALQALRTVLAVNAANLTDAARNRTSSNNPFGEERPYLETLLPPPYHTHAYHNPFPSQNGEDLSKKLYRGMLRVTCALGTAGPQYVERLDHLL